MKFKVGQKVQVVLNAQVDADEVAGRIGKVIEGLSSGSVLVHFSRWAKGHGAGNHNWYVNPKYLVRVKVSRRA
jgi:hypothetical protein